MWRYCIFEQDYLYISTNHDLECCDDIFLQVSPHGDTTLHIAARLGQERIVRLIIERFHGLKLFERENYIGNLTFHEVKILLSPSALASISLALALDNSTGSYASKILKHKNNADDSTLHSALRNSRKEVAHFYNIFLNF